MIRATTSLPDPVGPRIITERSVLATVRIDSKIIIIFSSRPIISRKRWTDGDRSSVDSPGRSARKSSSELRQVGIGGPGELIPSAGCAPERAHHAGVHQFPQAVVDIDADAAEGLHQRFDVVRLVRPRAQVAENSGTQRRLDQRLEAGPQLSVGAAAVDDGDRARKQEVSWLGSACNAPRSAAACLKTRARRRRTRHTRNTGRKHASRDEGPSRRSYAERSTIRQTLQEV